MSTRIRRAATRAAALASVGAAALALSACSSGENPGPAAPWATAKLIAADGADAGTVEFADAPGGTLVTVHATGLAPGFHGMHLHEIGLCEPDSVAPGGGEPGAFLSSGGHIAGDHGEHHHAGEGVPRQPGQPTVGHAGDLPPLLVREDGTADLSVVTDRVTRELLMDADGSAVIVHEGADNFGNVPERYAPQGPDADTVKTGDAGGRALCGVVDEA